MIGALWNRSLANEDCIARDETDVLLDIKEHFLMK